MKSSIVVTQPIKIGATICTADPWSGVGAGGTEERGGREGGNGSNHQSVSALLLFKCPTATMDSQDLDHQSAVFSKTLLTIAKAGRMHWP